MTRLAEAKCLQSRRGVGYIGRVPGPGPGDTAKAAYGLLLVCSAAKAKVAVEVRLA